MQYGIGDYQVITANRSAGKGRDLCKRGLNAPAPTQQAPRRPPQQQQLHDHQHSIARQEGRRIEKWVWRKELRRHKRNRHGVVSM